MFFLQNLVVYIRLRLKVQYCLAFAFTVVAAVSHSKLFQKWGSDCSEWRGVREDLLGEGDVGFWRDLGPEVGGNDNRSG